MLLYGSVYIYPASAGVYPTVSAYKIPCSNLPRVCGGVPLQPIFAIFRLLFTPRLRGCTYWCSKFAYIEVIYPASAGVYLIESGMKPKEIHLPRARGDVPVSFLRLF